MTACERQPTPIELLDDQLVLHSMLVAGDNIAAVLLTRARSTNGVYDEQISDPATGARVMLSYGTTTLMLLPQSDTLNRCVTYRSQIDFFGRGEDPQKDAYLRPGCYVARVPGRIQGGMGYTLHATIAGEGAITGTTMVPSQPLIRTPGYDAILPVHSPQANVPHLPVAWSMSANTSHSTVGLLLNRQECRATLMATEVELAYNFLPGYIRIPVTDRDSLNIVAQAVDCGTTDTASRYDGELMVTVYDTNYARFVLDFSRASKNTREVSFGVSGAAGIFAGAASARLPVVVQRTP